jgi:hypothetical protein
MSNSVGSVTAPINLNIALTGARPGTNNAIMTRLSATISA